MNQTQFKVTTQTNKSKYNTHYYSVSNPPKDKILVLDSNSRSINPHLNTPYNINSGDTFKPQIRDFFDDIPKTPGSPQTIHIPDRSTHPNFHSSLNHIYSVKSLLTQPNTGNTTNHNTTKYNNNSLNNT